MHLIHTDFRKGTVKARITSADDLWHLKNIIEPGDVVRGKATRKIKKGENEESIKRTMTLTVQAESIEFDAAGNALRVSGKTLDELEDIPKGSYHTLTLEEGSEFSVEKERWLAYQQKKLQEAVRRKVQQLVCIFDREDAFFYLTKSYGHEIVGKLHGDAEKKEKRAQVKGGFYKEIVKALAAYAERYKPDAVILASPAFYKEDLLKEMPDGQLKKQIVLAACSSVHERSITEVLKRPELKEALKQTRLREESLLVDELLRQIQKDGPATYGKEEVQHAAEMGAIETLLVSEALLGKARREGWFPELEKIMQQADAQKGEVHLISPEHEGGRQLDALGGIGALLRFPIRYKVH